MAEKLCIDCRHHYKYRGEYGYHHDCKIPYETGVSPVTGPYSRTTHCWAMREKGAKCGPSGKLWEAKPPRSSRTFWQNFTSGVD